MATGPRPACLSRLWLPMAAASNNAVRPERAAVPAFNGIADHGFQRVRLIAPHGTARAIARTAVGHTAGETRPGDSYLRLCRRQAASTATQNRDVRVQCSLALGGHLTAMSMTRFTLDPDRVFPDHAYAPGYEPKSQEVEQPQTSILTVADFIRFFTAAGLVVGGLSLISMLISGI